MTPAPDQPSTGDPARQYHRERQRQVRGLVFLAIAAIVFAILRAGISHVFTHGWWRFW